MGKSDANTLWITSFEFTPGKFLSVEGYALTEADIAKLIDALKRSPHYGEYNLGYVKSIVVSHVPMKEFTLSLVSTPIGQGKTTKNKTTTSKKARK